MMDNKGQVNWFEIIGLVALLLVIGLSAFAILRPILHPGDVQKADNINNYNYDQHSFIGIGGCQRIPPYTERKPEIKPNVAQIAPVVKR